MTKVSHEGIRQVLGTCGPLTSHEVWTYFPDSTHQNTGAMISTMRRLAKKQVYIHSWIRTDWTERHYLTAVYALGDLPDARKPRKMTVAERCKRYRQKQKLPTGPNSIWQWAGAQA